MFFETSLTNRRVHDKWVMLVLLLSDWAFLPPPPFQPRSIGQQSAINTCFQEWNDCHVPYYKHFEPLRNCKNIKYMSQWLYWQCTFFFLMPIQLNEKSDGEKKRWILRKSNKISLNPGKIPCTLPIRNYSLISNNKRKG